MDKQQMKFKIKESFNERTPDVLDKIKNSSEFKVPVKTKKSIYDYFSFKQMAYSLATVFILAILVTLVFTSKPAAPVIASTVTVDINPSIEITLDEFDNVINITAINDDGEEIINKDINYRGLSLDRAIELLIERAYDKGFIVDTTDENVILINVDTTNQAIKERVEAQLEIKLASEVNKYAPLVRVIKESGGDITPQELHNLAEIARNNRITIAKLLLINKIIVLDDSYTLADLKDQSIRELYILHYQLLSPIEGIEDLSPSELQNATVIAQTNRITVAQVLIINKIILLDDTLTLEELKELTIRELHGLHYKLLNIVEDETPGNNDDSQGNSN